MLINEIYEFHIIDAIERADEAPRVLLENKNLRKKFEVSGKVLEAQYRIGENYLLLVTEGNPMEEALYVYYFSGSLHLLDSLELSAMYSEGIIRNISISDSGDIKFPFFDNEDLWVLKVYSVPKYDWFNNKYPVKRKKAMFRKKWLSLKKA